MRFLPPKWDRSISGSKLASKLSCKGSTGGKGAGDSEVRLSRDSLGVGAGDGGGGAAKGWGAGKWRGDRGADSRGAANGGTDSRGMGRMRGAGDSNVGDGTTGNCVPGPGTRGSKLETLGAECDVGTMRYKLNPELSLTF